MRDSLKKILNSRNIGIWIILCSLTLSIFSGITVYRMKTQTERIESIQKDTEKAEKILNTEEFNRTLEVLESIETSSIGYKISEISGVLRTSANSLKSISEMAEDFRELYKLYQWIFLYSLLGIVAGISVMVI